MKIPERPGLFAAGAKVIADWLQARAQSKAAAMQAAPPPAVEKVLDPTDPTAGVTAASLSARATSNGARSSSIDVSVESAPAAQAATAPVASAPVIVARAALESESQPVSTPRRPVRSAAARALRQSLAKTGLGSAKKNSDPDADQGEPTNFVPNFRLKTAVIWAGAGFVVIGFAWFIATHIGQPSKESALAKKTAKAAVDPLTGRASQIGRRQSTAEATTDGRESLSPPGGPAGVNSQFTTPTSYLDAPLLPNGAAQRKVGLNYCIIKSFVPEMRDQAIEASHALSDAGISNTIEPGSSKLRSESGSWIIIGARGFERGYSKSADYAQYMADLSAAVAKAPAKARLRPLQQTLLIRWPE